MVTNIDIEKIKKLIGCKKEVFLSPDVITDGDAARKCFKLAINPDGEAFYNNNGIWSGIAGISGGDPSDPVNLIAGANIGITGTYPDKTIAFTGSIPAQFNPIQGTNMTITGSYPNLTFNAAGSTDTLNTVVGRNPALTNDIVGYASNGVDTLTLKDKMIYYADGSAVDLINELDARLLWRFQDEKYNTNDPNGKKYGRYNEYITWNNYNGGPSSTHRRGLVHTFGYNVTGGGGEEITGEGEFHVSLESDYGRTFEYYTQATGIDTAVPFSYRPFMIRSWKDQKFCDFSMSASFLHITPIAVAQNYFKTENGRTAITNVVGQTSPSSSNTILAFERDNAGSITSASITYNGTSLIYEATGGHVFSQGINPIANGTLNNGTTSAKWATLYTNAIVAVHKSVPDANYTLLSTDHTLNFRNITANRTLTMNNGGPGRVLHIVTGQPTYKITFAGSTVKNPDGTTAVEIPAGKGCTLSFCDDNSTWLVVSVSANL